MPVAELGQYLICVSGDIDGSMCFIADGQALFYY